jgi:hypothetical protein
MFLFLSRTFRADLSRGCQVDDERRVASGAFDRFLHSSLAALNELCRQAAGSKAKGSAVHSQ